MKLLSKYSDQAYALLRIVSGLMFAVHGAGKIFGFMSDSASPINFQMWLGGMIELIGGVLITAGLFTRVAAFLSSGTMAVAYTQFHWKYQLGANFFPSVNRGELALLYCLVFFFIACKGSGRFGFDKVTRSC